MKEYKKDSIVDNFAMHYYYIDETKANRMKYLSQLKTIIQQTGEYSNYRLLFKLLKKRVHQKNN